MIDFKDADLLSVMPENLSKPETQALSTAIKSGLQSLHQYARAAPLYAAVEELPDEALNLLALELRVQYYEPDAKRNIREGMIKQTVAWYLRGGTGSVLAEYLGTLFQGGTLQEWYTYEGKPYFFKAIVNLALDDVIHVGDGEMIIDRMNVYKNVRSWLEELAFCIGAEYVSSIHCTNAVTFQTLFHPRFNIGYLHLDETWALDGGRCLNGYNDDDVLDFYPMLHRTQIGILKEVLVEEHLRCEDRFLAEIQAAEIFKAQAEAAETMQSGEELHTVTSAEIGMITEEKFHVVQKIGAKIKEESVLRMQSATGELIRVAERMQVQMQTQWPVECTSYMTKMNLMNVEWKLNGSRKLDGGRYVL